MSFDAFLNDLPLIHSWDGGETWCLGGFDPDMLARIRDFIGARTPPGAVFLETGAGLSTITLLSLSPSRLISIAPDAALFARIEATCTRFGIPDTSLDARIDGSEWVLPELAKHYRESAPPLDFVLIDGCHGWPTAFVDLEYGNAMLKEGGYLLVDDGQLHSLKEMARLLSDHPAFSLVHDLGKALIFQKVLPDRHLGEWCAQPYIIDQTEAYSSQADIFSLAQPGFTSRLRGLFR
jgi:hypothetical protein